MHAASAIERVLSEGKKSSTYKLALLRAIVDYVIESPQQVSRNGLHFVPLIDLARRALMYYWRPAIEGIRQGSDPRQQVIPGAVLGLRDNHSKLRIRGVDLTDPGAGFPLALWMMQAKAIPKEVLSALLRTRRTLLEQPIQYVRNIGDRRLDLFSLMTAAPADGHQHFLFDSYENQRKHALGIGKKLKGPNWACLLGQEQAFLVLSARTFEEISSLRFWLRDAIILRWIKECERFNTGDQGERLSIHSLELTLPERDPGRVQELKALYQDLGLDQCLYTRRNLSESWDLDHILPFSRFPVNLFWNLVPSHPAANRGKGGKFDKVPEITPEFMKAYRQFLRRCLSSNASLVFNDVAASYRRYFQTEYSMGQPDSEKTLLEMLSIWEANHQSLVDAGVEVWKPVQLTG